MRSHVTPAEAGVQSRTPWIPAFAGMTIFLFVAAVWALPEVYFSPGGVQAHLVAAIDGTSRSLDVAIYELSANSLIRALRRAGERGIPVRLILDEQTLREHPQDKELANATHISLRTLGGQDKHRGMMHNKFSIFDHDRVLTGSYNWSQGAEFANYENALFEDDTSIVRAYSGEFADLWDRANPVQPGFVAGRVHRVAHHEKWDK